MDFIQNIMNRFFPPAHPIPSGIYHYQAPADSEMPYRLHLRLEQDGSGLLIINASTVLHLNQTAAEYAYHLVQGTPVDQVSQGIAKRYRVKPEQAQSDFEDLKSRIETLISSTDLDPVTYLDFDRTEPYRANSAPYRLDCALTYRVADSVLHPVAPQERVKRELMTEEWQLILKKAWDAGVPHIIFTGGEPTMRPDLPELIAYCESLGQVTGLLTDGLRLAEPVFMHTLLQKGLDHIMIVLDPAEEQSWEGIKDALVEDIFVTVHLTITQQNAEQLEAILQKLSAKGAQSISLSAASPNLKPQLDYARQLAAELGMSLVWDLPVPYSAQNPVAYELEETDEIVEGAGKAWLYVEPDGDVLPGQGQLKVIGNLLSQTWDEIWQNPDRQKP